MEKINFRKLLANNIEGNSDDVKFCIKLAEEQQADGSSTDAELMEGLLKHLANQSNYQRIKEIVKLNTAMAKSIKELEDMGCWPQLNGIAKHALESEIRALEKEPERPFYELVAGHKIRLAVLKMGSDEFLKVFKQDFLDKMHHQTK